MAFAELHCITNYSFLRAASHPEEMVRTAFLQGYSALAITDECSMAGVVKAWDEYKNIIRENPDTTFKLILGTELRFHDEIFVLLATNKQNYENICTLISTCRQQAEKGSYHFHPSFIEKNNQLGIVLWKPSSKRLQYSESFIQHNKNPTYLLLQLNLTTQDITHTETIKHWSSVSGFKVAASSYPHMHKSERKALLDTLVAIRKQKNIRQSIPNLAINSEHCLRSIKKLRKIYPEQCLENTLSIAEQCSFSLCEIRYQYPRTALPKSEEPTTYLRKITYKGANKRYNNHIPEKVKQQIDKELRVIAELAYEYYFSTIHDIVSFAKRNNILCQGRGSAANSVVCYCLFITDVDPTKVNLLFERFISKRRQEPPDIDVDFENSRREEVIQYIYQRYGRQHTALAASVICYRPKSAFRDIGKALGIDLKQLENIIANYGWRYRNKDWPDDIITHELTQHAPTLAIFKELVVNIIGFPRHLSQHVGGMVITEQPLSQLVPIESTAMENRTVIQWDKTDLESLGLMKVDILALGMLSAMRYSFNIISSLTRKPFSLASIPKQDDPLVFRMLQKADTVGLFQVESRAQMNMLPRLKPTCYYDLVVQVAIVRPGPIQGDMVHPYLRRKHGEEPSHIPLPSLEPILARTYGVPIFQEQVIAMAMHAADFTAEEAEDLRRSMATWKSQGHMHRLRQKLTQRLLEKGLNADYVQRICQQIEGFGEYGFPESHAASFAWLAYASAWLKYYYPTEFFCGLLNAQPMGFYQPWQLIQDAQRHNVIVYPVSINNSQWEHTVEIINHEKILQLGFRIIQGVSQERIAQLIEQRPPQGFTGIDKLPHDKTIKPTIETLAAANALAELTQQYEALHRHQAYWLVSQLRNSHDLFPEEEPNNNYQARQPSRSEDLMLDHMTTRVILNDHPMALLREATDFLGCYTAASLFDTHTPNECFVAGLVINRQRPKTSAGVTFLTLEDETGSINVVVWLKTAHAQLKELTQSKLLKIYGKVEKDDNNQIVHVIAYRLFDLSRHLGDINTLSRDFH